jgi:hypothetical protein
LFLSVHKGRKLGLIFFLQQLLGIRSDDLVFVI